MQFEAAMIAGLPLIRTHVGQADVEAAKQLRARRDQLYPNIYAPEVTDERWIGDLAEACVDAWLAAESIPHVWLVGDHAAGTHDFEVGAFKIGVKAVKRQDDIRAGYTAQITAKHAEEPVDGFFFASFTIRTETMWLLGAIGKPRFLREATYYGAGESVHPNYTVRKDHEIWNIEIAKLTPPAKWLEVVRSNC